MLFKQVYNLDKKDFEAKLAEEEIPDQTRYEVAEEDANEEFDEEEDDSVLADSLIGEDERQMLEMAEAEDDEEEIEDLPAKMLGKRRKAVTIKRESAKPEIEYELEEEELGKPQAAQMLKNEIRVSKKRKVQ